MTAAAGGTSVAALAAQAAQAQATLAQLTGGTAAGGGATPATGAATGAAGTTAATGANATTGAQAFNPGPYLSVSGKQLTLTKLADGKLRLAAPTGVAEQINIEGKLVRFNAQGVETRLFQMADQETVKLDLDHRDGIAVGISNLSTLIAGRQERIKKLSDALTSDANDVGSINQTDLQRLTLENQTTENITGMQKKIYDSVQNSIQAWLR